jgi:hypothetical protein
MRREDILYSKGESMNNDKDLKGPSSGQLALAQWLQQVMQEPPIATASFPQLSSEAHEAQLELLLNAQDYHLQFYQMLPDFAMALLNNDAEAPARYAPLLYHLVGCQQCRHGYLDIYDALRAAVQPRGARPLLGQGTRTLSAMPQRMLGHLCRIAIIQAEAVIRQGQREDSATEAQARTLLQMALRIGAQIGQSGIRRQALQQLVRVAALAQGHEPLADDGPEGRAYTPALAGAGGLRGKKIVRRAETGHHGREVAEDAADMPAIALQSRALGGSIVQRGKVLELHLKDLDAALRGHRVRVSVLLGSLIEPVRWYGGNPHALLSPQPVGADGSLHMPLGETDLRLSNTEEYHLLETMFMLLEVRKA